MRLLHSSLACVLLVLHALPTTGESIGARALMKSSHEHYARRQLAPLADEIIRSSSSSEKGTKDAPVDGLDGKPHKGPFVEDSVAKASAADRSSSLEGGVSERARDRESGESAKIPDPPKAALSVPDGEHKVIGMDRTVSTDKTSLAEADEAAKPKGAAGITKPNDLPSLPSDKHGKGDRDDFDDGEDDDDDDDDDDDHDDDHDHDHDPLPFDSFIGAFLSILVSEIGDKTFLIAALMAMRHPRLQVFTAAASALVVMTVLSAVTGHAVGSLLSKGLTALIAGLFFLFFGGKSMQEGLAMRPDQGVSEEMEEVRAELEEKEESMAQRSYGRRVSSISPYALEAGRAGQRSARAGTRLPIPRSPSESPSRSMSPSRPTAASAVAGVKNLLSLLLSPAWVEVFAMTFVGELGDRSQIATVAMAAGQEYVWIMIGATAGHMVCTSVAVLGGSALAGRVSMRKVTLIGAWVFIAFGLYTLYEALLHFHD